MQSKPIHLIPVFSILLFTAACGGGSDSTPSNACEAACVHGSEVCNGRGMLKDCFRACRDAYRNATPQAKSLLEAGFEVCNQTSTCKEWTSCLDLFAGAVARGGRPTTTPGDRPGITTPGGRPGITTPRGGGTMRPDETLPGQLPRTGSGDRAAGQSCTTTDECKPGLFCLNGTCVGTGTGAKYLRVSLTFTADSDFDLHLKTPTHREIFYGNRSADGGTLDVDQCVSSCTAGGQHVENIVFPESAPGGTYKVWIHNFSPRNRGTFTIRVEGETLRRTFTGTLEARVSNSEEFTFSL